MVAVLKKLSLDTIEHIATVVLWCKLRSVYDFFPNLHNMCRQDTYLYVHFEKHIWSFSLILFLQSVLVSPGTVN